MFFSDVIIVPTGLINVYRDAWAIPENQDPPP
jgi:hypothetical protein